MVNCNLHCIHHTVQVAQVSVQVYMYIPPPQHTSTYYHHWPPSHSASCLSASANFVSVGGWKSNTSASCRGDTTLYRLVLMLALNFVRCVLTFEPCILIFAPCTCGVFLLSTGANIPLAQVVVVTSCKFQWWCFFLQPLVQRVHLHMW